MDRADSSLREVAERIVCSTELEAKLEAPARSLVDEPVGRVPEYLPREPRRESRLAIRSGPETKVPPLEGMADPAQRARILHAFANHELQAVELFAWALLAFPESPSAFRQGLLSALRDEQRHARLYIERLEEHGVRFGDHPLSGYFWGKLEHFSTPLRFVCSMCLTFENANLDHTLDYAAAAEAVGDKDTAAVLREVHADEIRHVRFGLQWLEQFKEADQSCVEAWESSLVWPLRPALARGRTLHEDVRSAVGLPPDFLARLAASEGARS